MKQIANCTVLIILLFGSTSGSAQDDTGTPATEQNAAAREQFFRDQVLPILRSRCWDCHGTEVQESDLRLDSRRELMTGGSSGEVIAVAGKPEASYLFQVLQHGGGVDMPPDDKLSPAEIGVIRRWITEGLFWPVDDAAHPSSTKEEELSLLLKQHWAFQPIGDPELPVVRNGKWIAQPLDRFILAQLEHHGLTPSPAVDRYRLIRRLKFDLLGLPPTPVEVADFINATTPDAYEKLVDRYLSSPQYGERWGRHWLDVARYADTKGYAFTRDRRYPFAYTYRDFVIRSFNEDLPFNQFILKQLAADLLPERSNGLDLAALGFLTVGRKYNNRHLDVDDQIDVVGRGLLGLTIACARCHDHKYDPIPTEDYYAFYGVFASSSEPDDLPVIGDPTQLPGYEEYKQELEQRQAELKAFKEQKRDEIAQSTLQHAADYLARAITRESEESLQKQSFIALKGEAFRSKLIPHWRQRLATMAGSDHPVLGPLFELVRIPDEEYAKQAPPILEKWQNTPAGTDRGTLNPIVKEAVAKESMVTKLDLARIYGQVFTSVLPNHKHDDNASNQGAAQSSGDKALASQMTEPPDTPQNDVATQQVLTILTGPGSLTDIDLDETVRLFTRAEGNKYRELQRRIESFQVDSPGSPPRAMVVTESETPYNPHVFIRGNPARPGKTVPRQFLRLLAGPERKPFQQGSGRLELAQSIISPSNPLTARVIVNRVWMHHFGTPLVRTPSDFGTRCERPTQAELLDHLATQLVRNDWSLKALHRSIVLSNTYRQASLRRTDCELEDPENNLYWRMNVRRLEFEAMHDALLAVSGQLDLTMGGRPVKMTQQPYATRRAVYGFIDRQDLPGLYRVFDLASPDQSCPRRARTTVPQQALFLMNSPFVLQCAKHLLTLPDVATATTVDHRIDALYRATLARSPTPQETDIAEQFLAANVSKDRDAQQRDILQQYAHLLLMSNAFMFVD